MSLKVFWGIQMKSSQTFKSLVCNPSKCPFLRFPRGGSLQSPHFWPLCLYTFSFTPYLFSPEPQRIHSKQVLFVLFCFMNEWRFAPIKSKTTIFPCLSLGKFFLIFKAWGSANPQARGLNYTPPRGLIVEFHAFLNRNPGECSVFWPLTMTAFSTGQITAGCLINLENF